MVNVTYNIKLMFSSYSDKKALTDTLEVSRTAFNECVEFLKQENVHLDIKSVHDNVYDWMRNKFNTLPAQAIIKIYKEALAALRSIKSNKHKNAETPQKKSLEMRLDKRLYSNFNMEGISLSGISKGKRTRATFVLYDKVKDMFSKYGTTDPLLFCKNGDIYLSATFEVPSMLSKDNSCIGVDLGVKRFITTSDGLVFQDKEYNAKKRRLRYLKRCLASKGTKSAKRHLKKLRRKERNLSKLQTYKAVNILLSSTDKPYIAIEDLSKLKKNTSKTKKDFKRTRHNNMISQVPFYGFKRILTYKAALAGKQVVSVSPMWTSQTDSRTGKRNGKRVGCRYYCSDGVVLDADWNAAVNIGIRSKHPISSCVPTDGALRPLIGRLCVNQPNAK